MAISYDVAVAALAIDVPQKWIDNLLSRHRLPGVEQAHQGVARRISRDALVTIAIVRLLCAELRIPLERAVDLAERLSPIGDTTLTSNEGTVTITVDRSLLARTIATRLADAIESAPRRPRGRPRQAGRTSDRDQRSAPGSQRSA